MRWLFLLAMAPFAGPAFAAGLPGGASALTETFQDWTVTCSVQDGRKSCTLSQQQTNASGQRLVAIEFGPLTAGKLEGVLVLPFGLDLDKGATLQLGDDQPLPVRRFKTCLAGGCVVPMSFTDKQAAAMSAAPALKVSTVSVDGGGSINFVVSLNGFQTALERVNTLMK